MNKDYEYSIPENTNKGTERMAKYKNIENTTKIIKDRSHIL